jgi:hypothetical protein
MMLLRGLKAWVWVLILFGCVSCGAVTTGIKPALAALGPLTEETCSMTWRTERRPAGLTWSMDFDCAELSHQFMQLRSVQRLNLNRVDRKW